VTFTAPKTRPKRVLGARPLALLMIAIHC
jgi:hypothetical protein